MYKLEYITKHYKKLSILERFNLEIEKNKITCLFGPSGCGKTTILKILSGVDKNFKGKVSGIDYNRISFVFQENRLIPWLTVYENLEFILKGKIPIDKLDKIISQYLSKLNILEFKNAYPNELSGGMKQRVSIARALAYPHDLLLLDEPFQGLDDKLKNDLIELIKKSLVEDGNTSVIVTHQMSDAKIIADKIIYLAGRPLKVKLL
ncbi:MAG: ATP-binding cassette domain-containing protein [Clostridiales bacterium]